MKESKVLGPQRHISVDSLIRELKGGSSMLTSVLRQEAPTQNGSNNIPNVSQSADITAINVAN